MSQTPQSEAERLLILLQSKSVEDLKNLRAGIEAWLALVSIILERAEKKAKYAGQVTMSTTPDPSLVRAANL